MLGVLVCAQPTRGVDVGAIERIHAELAHARVGGKAVLLISADLDELLALSDRIVVLYRGPRRRLRRQRPRAARRGARRNRVAHARSRPVSERARAQVSEASGERGARLARAILPPAWATLIALAAASRAHHRRRRRAARRLSAAARRHLGQRLRHRPGAVQDDAAHLHRPVGVAGAARRALQHRRRRAAHRRRVLDGARRLARGVAAGAGRRAARARRRRRGRRAASAPSPGALKAWRGAHEVINTIMLNFIVRAVMVGVGAHLFEREQIHTAPIARLGRAAAPRRLRRRRCTARRSTRRSFLARRRRCSPPGGCVERTRAGFRLRAVGASPEAAATSGIVVGRVQLVRAGALRRASPAWSAPTSCSATSTTTRTASPAASATWASPSPCSGARARSAWCWRRSSSARCRRARSRSTRWCRRSSSTS